ncbi:hypothetical protein Cassandra_0370 [Pseudomonas phage Cassandra]|nr:hypothetical protein Cassandra_0370 [Pseudomonas phage Cassandra]
MYISIKTGTLIDDVFSAFYYVKLQVYACAWALKRATSAYNSVCARSCTNALLSTTTQHTALTALLAALQM